MNNKIVSLLIVAMCFWLVGISITGVEFAFTGRAAGSVLVAPHFFVPWLTWLDLNILLFLGAVLFIVSYFGEINNKKFADMFIAYLPALLISLVIISIAVFINTQEDLWWWIYFDALYFGFVSAGLFALLKCSFSNVRI